MADSGSDIVPPLNLAFTTKEFNLFVHNLLTEKSQHVVIPSTPSTQEKPGVEAESSSTTNLMSAYLNLTTEVFNMFVHNLLTGKSQHVIPSTPSATQEKLSVEAGSSSTTNPMSANLNLPHHLKSCLDYSYFVLSNSAGCQTTKTRLACLLLAEGLIKHDNSSTLDEDAASSVIDQLIGLGMLEIDYIFMEWVRIPSTYQKLYISEVDKKHLFAKAPDLAIRLYILDDKRFYLYPNLCSLTITSLFDFPAGRLISYEKFISRAYMETICKVKSLVVLDLKGYIECLPNEIGDLVHLKYLRLIFSKLKGKSFVSFEMMFCHVNELPCEVLDIQRLWHLMINTNTFKAEVGVPRKIELRLNLFTLTRIDARGGIRSELSNFTQLRRLEIRRVSDEHATELCAAIMKMTYLHTLSMEAEYTTFVTGNKKEGVALFPELEAFSPPSRLQNVKLMGLLVEIPGWLLSMENLSSVSLWESYLHDDSIFLIQFLPNLKHLELYNASRSKQIGENLCQAGGFPKLEVLRIRSSFLVEWTEIANGAFPSLRSLNFIYCPNLMVLPDGLQNITTLDKLYVYPICWWMT